MFLSRDGAAWVTGYNNQGRLGLGDETDRSSPTQVVSLTNVVDIIAGGMHAFFLTQV